MISNGKTTEIDILFLNSESKMIVQPAGGGDNIYLDIDTIVEYTDESGNVLEGLVQSPTTIKVSDNSIISIPMNSSIKVVSTGAVGTTLLNEVDNIDIAYQATDFQIYAKANMADGFFKIDNSDILLTGNLEITLQPIMAVLDGYVVNLKVAKVFGISSGGAKPRIDTIIIKKNQSSRTVTFEVKQGLMADSPTAPTLTKIDDGEYELAVANIYVTAGTASISASNITDVRQISLLPTVRAELDTLQSNVDDIDLYQDNSISSRLGAGSTVGGEEGDVAIGSSASATGRSSTAVGQGAKATLHAAVAYGYDAQATEVYSIACGSNSRSSARSTIAVGFQSNAGVENAIALGVQSNASGSSAIAIGTGSYVNAGAGVAIGGGAKTSTKGVAIGEACWATHLGATAIGASCDAVANHSTCLGYQTNTSGVNALAVGNNINTSGAYSINLGTSVNSRGENNIVIGHGATDIQDYANTPLSSTNSVMIGKNSQAVGNGSIAIGENAKVISEAYLTTSVPNQGIAIGTSAKATRTNCVAIGQSATSVTDNYIRLGSTYATVQVQSNIQVVSDRRDKRDIEDISVGLDFINKLRPTEYRVDPREAYLTEDESDISKVESTGEHAGKRLHAGLIAQEVKEVFEDMGVDYAFYKDENLAGGADRMSLSYEGIVPILIKAVQELSAKVDSLELQLANK